MSCYWRHRKGEATSENHRKQSEDCDRNRPAYTHTHTQAHKERSRKRHIDMPNREEEEMKQFETWATALVVEQTHPLRGRRQRHLFKQKRRIATKTSLFTCRGSGNQRVQALHQEFAECVEAKEKWGQRRRWGGVRRKPTSSSLSI